MRAISRSKSMTKLEVSRKRSFTAKTGTDLNTILDNDYSGIKTIVNGAKKKFGIALGKALAKSFIIGDAGGSGTRLVFGTAGKSSVVVAAGLPLMASKFSDLQALFKDKIKGAFTWDYTVILATAGMRAAIKANTAPDTKTLCHTDYVHQAGSDKCIVATMPGSVEGYLGWYDGNTGDTDCYVEFGSTSAQFVHPVSANPNVKGKKLGGTGINLFSLSGVNLGFDPIANLAKTTCDKTNGAWNPDTCVTDIKELFDLNLNVCVGQYKKSKGSDACNKVLLKGLPKDPYFDDLAGDVFTKCDAVKSADTAGFKTQYACGRIAMWKKWLVTDLGLDKSKFSFVDDSNIKVEWHNGLMNLLIDLDFDLSKFPVKNMVNGDSDCMQFTVS